MPLAAFKPSKGRLLDGLKRCTEKVSDAQVENQIICLSNTCKTSLNNSIISFLQLLKIVGMRHIWIKTHLMSLSTCYLCIEKVFHYLSTCHV